MHTDHSYSDPVGREIVEIHELFERWFAGTCGAERGAEWMRVIRRFHPEFTVIPPSGYRFGGAGFWPRLQEAYGKKPGFKISIRDVRRSAMSTDSLVVATYEEWQQNATDALGGQNPKSMSNGRISTCVFRPDPSLPNGLLWVHQQETWLPPERLAAERFDW